MSATLQPELFSSPGSSQGWTFDGDAFGAGLGTVPVPRFDGETFDPALDGNRLARQLDAVGQWMLRDLRKPRFGSYVVERRRASPSTWEYRVLSNVGSAA